MSKYHNKKTQAYGKTFDSKREAKRFQELSLMEIGGVITDLRCQVPFELVPAQRDGRGKVIERPVKYIADFVYYEGGQQVVEDSKGHRTREFVIKRKLMLERYGIRIREV